MNGNVVLSNTFSNRENPLTLKTIDQTVSYLLYPHSGKNTVQVHVLEIIKTPIQLSTWFQKTALN